MHNTPFGVSIVNTMPKKKWKKRVCYKDGLTEENRGDWLLEVYTGDGKGTV